MKRTLMAVHAHPDDEAISTGGLLARYAEAGVHTVLVTCTGGEVGEIAYPDLADADTLAEVRQRELSEACAMLGVGALHLLGYRDSGMAGTPDNEHPDSFHQADLDEAARKLVALIRAERPQVLVTYDENGFYGHPDHIKANRITVAAWEAAGDANRYPDLGLEPWAPQKLYYTTVGRSAIQEFGERLRNAGIEAPFGDEEPSFGVPDEMITTVLDVTPWVEQKRNALLVHRTQMGPELFFARMPPDVFYDVFAREAFIRVASRVPAPTPEDDVFAGLP